jgi:hypothetical protein
MDWETNRRTDGRIEYICDHGCGHTDYGSVLRIVKAKGITSEAEIKALTVHGCDGCCTRDDFPGTKLGNEGRKKGPGTVSLDESVQAMCRNAALVLQSDSSDTVKDDAEWLLAVGVTYLQTRLLVIEPSLYDLYKKIDLKKLPKTHQ